MLHLEVLGKAGDEVYDQLHVLAAVEHGLRMQAVVAAAAVLLVVLLAEVVQQELAAALAGFSIRHHFVQELAADFLFRHRLALHELLQLAYVLVGVVSDAKAFLAVAAGTASLLIVTFYALGDVVVDHEAHVRLVDTHAEGNRSHDDIYLLHQELVLILGPHPGIEPRVIGQGPDAVDAEEGRHFFHLLAAQAIDDARFAGILADETHDILLRFHLVPDLVVEIRPVERRFEDHRIVDAEVLEDVALHLGGGGSSEGDDGRAAYLVHEAAYTPVFRAEIVAPFGDAVRFVHCVEGYVDFFQKGYVLFLGEGFGSNVEYLGAPGDEICLHVVYLLPRKRGIQEVGYALVAADESAQHIHLVLHECDERGDHDCRTVRHKGGQLVAETLPSPRRHEHKGIAAVEKVVYHPFLVSLEVIVPEEFLQSAVYFGRVVLHI